jgi:diacylglycerol O-acyltransferase
MLDRLSPQDASNLRVEARGLPMHVAGLAILDGAPLCDSGGRLKLEALRGEIASRMQLAPRLRQVLYRPGFGLGPPLWVDDPRFDVDRHVLTRSVPPPGDEAALLATVQELNEPPLERSRPLWELWFLTGLTDGRVGMLIRLHHVVADGIASLALISSLFDFAPDAPAPIATPWNPSPLPSAQELFADNVRHRSAALAQAISSLVHPTRWLRQLKATIRPLRASLREGLAPRSSLNGPVGTHRRLIPARADLERAKRVAHAHGAKVNDVVLAAISGGARELLRSRGELVPGLTLRAMVPVSERGSTDPLTQGNLVALMTVPLPVGEPDPIRRLEQIAQATAERKGRSLRQWARFPSVLTRLMNHQRIVNMFTSNVPGPPTSMYFAGARVLEVFQIGVLQGNIRLAVGVLSYAGSLNFDIVADADSLPDLDVFAEGLRDALEELGTTSPITAATS